MRFDLLAVDRDSRARLGTVHTAHGPIETPAFMDVGTWGAVTGCAPTDLAAVGTQVVLGNTYHLMLRPGADAMRRLGGLHRFMRWNGPILTDSGGFQIFSLAADRVITEEGARFKSYVDQQLHLLSPERSIEMQTAIGSDIMMVLDECIDSRAPEEVVRAAMERTHRWALRSLAARTTNQGLFAIVQGGVVPALREESAAVLTAHPFDGFAIGGLAVGDTREERERTTAFAADLLPTEKPRYLMGVGTPPDLLQAMLAGVDMFDCILPTKMAWQGIAFTSTGRVRITRQAHVSDEEPLDASCTCSTCAAFSRAYLHHLFKCREPLAPRLLSLHNLFHYHALMADSRRAIEAGRFAAFARQRLAATDRKEHDPSG